MPDKAELTPAERTMRAKIAANARWAKATQSEREAQGKTARAGFDARFEDEVDPNRTLPPEERARRAANAKRAHMQRLALKSAKARRLRKRQDGATSGTAA